MAAFDKATDYMYYIQRIARYNNCKINFDDKLTEIEKMNEKGSNGVLGCLCKNSPCPCKDLKKDLEANGICYCEIFKRVN